MVTGTMDETGNEISGLYDRIAVTTSLVSTPGIETNQAQLSNGTGTTYATTTTHTSGNHQTGGYTLYQETSQNAGTSGEGKGDAAHFLKRAASPCMVVLPGVSCHRFGAVG